MATDIQLRGGGIRLGADPESMFEKPIWSASAAERQGLSSEWLFGIWLNEAAGREITMLWPMINWMSCECVWARDRKRDWGSAYESNVKKKLFTYFLIKRNLTTEWNRLSAVDLLLYIYEYRKHMEAVKCL